MVLHTRSPHLWHTRPLAAAIQLLSAVPQNTLGCSHILVADCNCNLDLREENKVEHLADSRNTVAHQGHQCIEQVHALVVLVQPPNQSHDTDSTPVYGDDVL